MWLFDEVKGDTSKDFSSNGNDGKLMNGPKWVDGKIGKALDFDGEADYVEIPDSDILDLTDEITISLWVRKGPGTSGAYAGVVSQDNTDLGQGWSILYYNNGLWFWARYVPVWDSTSWSKDLVEKEWTHIAVTYDGSVTKLYRDGKLDFSEDHKGAISTNSYPLTIARQQRAAAHFNGTIDEVALFNVALTEDDINSLTIKGLSFIAAVSPSDKIAFTWGNIKCANY
jgi:hypothetical protein